MATISGRGKGQHDHADHGTDDHRSGPALNSKDVPTFAPNFTVYLLPPDLGVSLFRAPQVLPPRRALLCAGFNNRRRRKWTIGEIVRGLEQEFSNGQDPRSPDAAGRPPLCPAGSPSSAGVVAAYWASLGLSPQAAQKNLQTCRVRIQSIDVQGAKELGAALSRLGVRVVQALARPDGRAGERLSRRDDWPN